MTPSNQKFIDQATSIFCRFAPGALVVQVASVALLAGLATASIGAWAASGTRQTEPAMPTMDAATNPPAPQKDFLGGLDRHLKVTLDRGLISPGEAKAIREEFRKFAEQFPQLYDRPGFEYAIPEAKPLRDAYQPVPKGLEGTKSRKITEILGVQTVSAENINEVFRRMFASKMADGIYFEMFVREAYKAMTDNGQFRKTDGTLDDKAISASLQRSHDAFEIWSKDLKDMKEKGQLQRFLDAVNSMLAYADQRNLSVKPWQVRKGIAQLGTCITATADMAPEAYVDSCAGTMLWMGEHAHRNVTSFVFYSPLSGEAGGEKVFVPWDAPYALSVYGAAFGDVQATVYDRFWKNYFKLYVGTAKAISADISAREIAELVTLERMVGRTAKLLNAYVEKAPFEGKAVSAADVRMSLDEVTRTRGEYAGGASAAMKIRFVYRETMKGVDQVSARAAMFGIK